MAKIDTIDRPTDSALLLFHFGDEIGGITKVQKLLFLIEKETKFGDEYSDEISLDFKPYKMGPFSPEVYSEIELLLNMNAIEDEPNNLTPSEGWELSNYMPDVGSEGLSYKSFRTTRKGHKIGKQLADVLDDEIREDLEKTIQRYNAMPLRQLLEYVYTDYDNWTDESEIKEQVLS